MRCRAKVRPVNIPFCVEAARGTLARVILKFTLSLSEYLEEQRSIRMRIAPGRVVFRNLYGLAVLAVALGTYVRLAGSGLLGTVLYLAAGGVLFERMAWWRMRATAAYRNDAGLREPIEIKIEESELVRTTAAGSAPIRWADILACRETQNLFLLQLRPGDVLALPKRAFLPGDLFRFRELRQKELIVKTVRENPDSGLLKFVVGWGIVVIVLMTLFIGDVHNFLNDLPRSPRANRTVAEQPAEKSPPASVAQLRGRGTVYLVPVGNLNSVAVTPLLEYFHTSYQLELHLLPAIAAPDWARNPARKQYVAEDLLTAIKLAYPKLAADPGAILIGLTGDDIYISELNWSYAFSFRDEERFAIISAARFTTDSDGHLISPQVLQTRVRKVLVRDIGILHYRLQSSSDYNSILYEDIGDTSDLDDLGENYLESDVQVRADLHVRIGDPCFVLRHYTAPEREHPEQGTVTGCSGWYKEAGLETVQVDLRYGLLLDQRTDFFVPDRIPLELTRVLRTQDTGARAFGIGGNHNLNMFLVGDKWPFTWMDLILEHGGRAHFKRSNWGFGYWDARYTNQDAKGSEFAGSTIEWAWPGWQIRNWGMTYQFSAGGSAEQPGQGALMSIRAYNGSRLVLTRDPSGNLLRARSPAGNELLFKYDSGNRVIQAEQKNGGRFEYSYDAAGRLIRVVDDAQRTTEYGYDSAGRMNLIAENGAKLCSIEYDREGWVRSETLADGRIYRFEYMRGGDGQTFWVNLFDSAGPLRRIHNTSNDYSLDEPMKGER